MTSIFWAFVQGIASVLPLSPDGGLILLEKLFKIQTGQSPDLHLMVQLGVILGMLVFFWRTFMNLRSWKILILGTLPAFLLGMIGSGFIETHLAFPREVVIASFLTGILFVMPEPTSPQTKRLSLNGVGALALAQIVALVPGIPKVGLGFHMGNLISLEREESIQWACMLTGTSIMGSAFLNLMNLSGFSSGAGPLFLSLLGAFVGAFMGLHFLIRHFKTHGLRPFGIALLALSLFSFIWILI